MRGSMSSGFASSFSTCIVSGISLHWDEEIHSVGGGGEISVS